MDKSNDNDIIMLNSDVKIQKSIKLYVNGLFK